MHLSKYVFFPLPLRKVNIYIGLGIEGNDAPDIIPSLVKNTLLYINDDFFLSISLSFILFVFLLDRLGEEDDLSTFFITVRGSAKISAKDTPGTAAVLTNFSIDSAHKSRPRYRAHWGAVYPRPKSRREQLAPRIVPFKK